MQPPMMGLCCWHALSTLEARRYRREPSCEGGEGGREERGEGGGVSIYASYMYKYTAEFN